MAEVLVKRHCSGCESKKTQQAVFFENWISTIEKMAKSLPSTKSVLCVVLDWVPKKPFPWKSALKEKPVWSFIVKKVCTIASLTPETDEKIIQCRIGETDTYEKSDSFGRFCIFFLFNFLRKLSVYDRNFKNNCLF